MVFAAAAAVARTSVSTAEIRPFAAFFSSSIPPQPKRLVLYSKPGCCLCDGVKEKLSAALSHSSAGVGGGISLEVRDITQNPEWEKLYEYEIPVIAKLLPDGKEQVLPRISPRLSVELVQKKIQSVFEQ